MAKTSARTSHRTSRLFLVIVRLLLLLLHFEDACSQTSSAEVAATLPQISSRTTSDKSRATASKVRARTQIYTHKQTGTRRHRDTHTHTHTENHGWPADLMIRSIDQLGPQVSLARETAMFTSMPVATNPARGLQGVKLASFECPSKACRN